MRFASTTRPALTPLGHRLLSISERKLANLDSPYSSRDDASALRKGVVVRQAILHAWRTVSDGVTAAELNDWSHASAMGLDVVSEEEEEDEEGTLAARGEEAWFEDLVSAFGDEDYVPEDEDLHEWTESSVASAFDDIEYDDEGMEAFTLTSCPPSTASPPDSPPQLASISHAFDSYDSLDDDSVVTVRAVYDSDDEEDDEEVYDGDDEDAEVLQASALPAPSNALQFNITPTSSLLSTLHYSELSKSSIPFIEDCIPMDFAMEPPLPPPLVQSTESSPSSSDDEGCITPPQINSSILEEDEDEVLDEEDMKAEGFAELRKASARSPWVSLL